MKYISQIYNIALRELDILRKNRIYGFCMLIFPALLVVFFTTMLDDGVALDLPVGVVDQDNSAMSRGLTRNLDAMQSSRVVYRFANVTEARNAMQEGKVYAYLLIPEGTAAKLMAGRQPKISYYYTMTCMTAGSMAMKDMKTIGSLGSAAVGQSTLSAKGASKEQIRTALQPVTVDAHMIANPEGSYNYSLTTVFVPGILMLFMALLSAYALGTEMKFGTGKEWLAMADGNILVAIIGKYIVHALVFLLVLFLYEYYIFEVLHFPRLGGTWSIVRLTLLHVSAGLGFGIFAFGLDALAAHVDEHLVIVASTRHLHVWLGIPCACYGLSPALYVVALPYAPLLDALSGNGAQRISRHRGLVPLRGTDSLHAAALVRTP